MISRLLMTIDAPGDNWLFAITLAQALAPHHIHVILATMGAPLRLDQRDTIRRIPSISLYESALKVEWMHNPWDDLVRAGDWLLGLEAHTRPDVIHVGSFTQAALPWKAPVVLGAQGCLMSWWEAVKGLPLPPDRVDYQARVAHGLQAAQRVVVPSAAFGHMLKRHYTPDLPLVVIPNGYARAASGAAPISKESFVLAYGRMWDEARNLGALIRTAPQLPAPVYIAGGGDTSELQPAGKDRGIRRLGTPGPRQLEQWYARAAVFASPARYDPLGLSIVAAGVAGCALVLGDIPMVREHWDGAALFVRDDAGLEDSLRQLLEDPALRRAWGERARERAESFTAVRMADAYMRLYGDLFPDKARPHQAMV